MVRVWEVCHHFAISSPFAPEIDFLQNFKGNRIFSVFGSKKQFFRLGASKKAPRTLRLSLLLRRGRRSPILGPKGRFWAPKSKNGWNSLHFAKMPGTAPEKHRNFDFGQVFPRKYLMFWHVGNHEILGSFMIFIKLSFFHEERGKGFSLFLKIMFFLKEVKNKEPFTICKTIKSFFLTRCHEIFQKYV